MRVLGTVLWGLVLGLLLDGAVGPAAATVGPRWVSRQRPELVVLHEWDTARRAAYAHGDVRSLRALYVRGSSAADADVAVLTAYAGRGLRVHGLTDQVFSARVTVSRVEEIRLVVVDRIAGGFVSGRGGCWRLPRDRPQTHAIDFRKVGGHWRVASVTARG